MTRLLLVAVVVLASVLTAVAQEDSPSPAQIGRLVRQLDSDDLTERLAAEAALLRLGPSILPMLPTPDQAPNPQVARSLTDVRRKLQQQATAAFTSASKVTLQGEDMPLAAVLKALGEQTNSELIDLRPRFGQVVTEPTLNVNFQDTPYWEALDTVLADAALEIYPFAGEGQFGLLNRAPNRRAMSDVASTQGPFRLVPERLLLEQQLTLEGGASCTLDLRTFWEPRLKPVVLFLDPKSVQAVDDTGKKLAMTSAGGELEIPVDVIEPTVPFGISLEAPSRDARQLKSVSGQLRAVVPGMPHTFTFDNIAQQGGKAQSQGNVEVVIDSVREAVEGIWEIRVRVRFDEDETGVDSYRNWVLQNPFHLRDAEGREVAKAGIETTLRTEREFGTAYFFSADEGIAGHRFEYTTPVAVIVQDIKFELKDLPLP